MICGLQGQTVVVIGGSSGIGLAREVQPRQTAVFDAADLGRLQQFFKD